MDIYKTPNRTKCFHMIFLSIVDYYSLLSYFPYVTCARSQDRILLFRHCLLGLPLALKSEDIRILFR